MYRAPRGTQDILPEAQPYWEFIYRTAAKVSRHYGYQRIDVPIFEETALFVRGVGEGTDIVEKEMYSFRDKGDNDLTLRPEFTAGVMRAYIEHGLYTWPQPVKLYSLGPLFRYERPQAGRYRQLHQFNIEAIGEQDPLVDAEVMSLMWRFFQELGFQNLQFQLNNIGCPQCRPSYLDALSQYYRQQEQIICADCRRRLERNPLRLLDCKVATCQPLIEEAPHSADYLCAECAQHFASLLFYLEALGRPYVINHKLVRGLDYYTKTVFEVWAEGIGAQNAICGGGRYDGLAEQLGAKHTPGLGVAAGLERLVMLLQQQGIPVARPEGPTAFFVYLGEEAKVTALRLMEEARHQGVVADCTFGDRSMKAQLKAADRARAKWAVIVAEEELRKSTATLRSLEAASQTEVPLENLVPWLKENA
ncbi:MAG: histidine--tRNA ligase [Anaerolineae bacterium]